VYPNLGTGRRHRMAERLLRANGKRPLAARPQHRRSLSRFSCPAGPYRS
jgi:hypothetical protein